MNCFSPGKQTRAAASSGAVDKGLRLLRRVFSGLQRTHRKSQRQRLPARSDPWATLRERRGAMAELRWIKASWFLVLVLQFTAATGQDYDSFTVRDGDEVSLPCFNVMDDQKNCDSTVWIFDDFKRTVAVYPVKDGQIVAEAKDKSDRLSVSENCSLVIKKVTDEDVGQYACIQYRSGQQQVQDAKVILSVVTIPLLSLTTSPSSPVTEHKDSEEVICSLSTYRTCTHKVKWMIEEEEVEEDHQDVMTSQSSCSASLKVKSGSFNTLRFNSWMCEVTVGDQVQKFMFRNPPSGDKTGENTTTTTTTEDDTISGWWRVILVPVGLAALIIIVVAVNIWARMKGEEHPHIKAHERGFYWN
ncbi:uncharacterized protein LOC130202348 isoform X2 [Pseudoliparis swirei]|uniref:uncharacterized protein LOC130202348 isoform X2 n=1 Tax=Pseudoliparis swirei TaxID=2059687 RepID=UPI0024BE0595|nr:uncharacterized protein LOC130202348 isoform X2 [Pseudoliparis swirei]